jgi:WD40 repeat protein
MTWCGRGDQSLIASTWGWGGSGEEVWLLRLDGRANKVLTFPRPKVQFLSASPDGHWLATGTFEAYRGFSVWDARSGKLVKDWDWGSDAAVAFSPDGRWLLSTTGRFGPQGAACYCWQVGTWEERARISLDRPTSSPGALAVAPDSRSLATPGSMTEVLLLRPDTLEEIATLAAPDTHLISGVAFNHDGSRLALAARQAIHLWDLRAVRQSLRELGLDWDGPDYPPPPEPQPLQVEVDPGPN